MSLLFFRLLVKKNGLGRHTKTVVWFIAKPKSFLLNAQRTTNS